MRKVKLSSVLAMVLSAFMLITSLPMAAFAVTPTIGTGAGTPNYDDYRGNGMTADAKGVMIYDDLAKYHKKSQSNVALSTDYAVATAKTSTTTTNVVTSYDECPYLYVDYAIYFDETIEGNTIKIRYGLSMMDSVEYVDANGNITKSDKSPIELSASYGNDAYPGEEYNAGYGMVYDDEGNLAYTTRYYREKAIIFYVINHTSYERIGQEDDVSILQDYIDQGYVVVTVDFKSHANATSPYIEQALVQLQAMFDDCENDAALKDLNVYTSYRYIYVLPEGCRIERDVWYWDSSIWGAEGTMDRYRDKWNQKISCESSYTWVDDKGDTHTNEVDYYKVGNLETVEEMIAKVGQYVDKKGYSSDNNGKPIEYKLSMNIIYPSQPKKGYEVPVYVQEGTGYTREDGVGTEYKRGTFNAFALNGYACAQYDHDYWPFLYRWGYQFHKSGSDYTLGTNLPKNAQAAMRCIRSLASELGYSQTYLGAAGISKATVGLSALSLKNNENYPHGRVAFTDFLTGENKWNKYVSNQYEGDIRDESGAVVKTILQPFSYYDEEHTEKISSDSCVTYISSGDGYKRLFGTESLASYEKVPLLVSGGLRDNYNCYNYWDESVVWFEEHLTENWLPLTQLDQGHSYPVGNDTEFGYNRGVTMLKYFDIYLRPDEDRVPEVLWATPFNGASEVACSTKWAIGPYTPYGWEMDSYYYPQAIQIRFLDAVDPASVNSGVTVTVTETGAKVKGTWVASQNDALYTFECDGLTPGTRYTIDITSGVKGKNGVALAETRKIGFKTEGTYALAPLADAYVSSNEPDKVFGSANKLQVSNAYTTLISYDTEHILDATKIQLKANGTSEATVNYEVFALANYKVDEDTLTYNTLTTSTAWASKVSLGTYKTMDGSISLDLAALKTLEGIGKYVTFAFVSKDKLLSDTPHVFTNDFETPLLGNALTKTVNDSTITIVTDKGAVTQNTSSTASAFSDFWWRATGDSKTASIVNSSTVPIQPGSTQALGIRVRQGANTMNLMNTLSNDAITADDLNKVYRMTVEVYAAQDITLTVGVTASTSISGGYDTFSLFETETYTLKKNTWTPITYVFTMTEKAITSQAVIGFKCNYQMDDNRLVSSTGKEYQDFWTYFDNLVVEECTPMLTVDSTEASGNNGFTLITTNPGAPLGGPITVTFDEAMDLSTFKKGMVVTNEKTGERIKGTWAAADATDKVFTFTTNGLMAGTTYTVKTTEEVKTAAGVACEVRVVKTVATEGNYAVKPIATSYVSKSNASTHYGLNTGLALTSDLLGVASFSAKTLASASMAKLYLDVESERNSAIRVYALDYTPDASLCYNSIKAQLTDANYVGQYEVLDNGTIGIDLADFAGKTFNEAVTFVLVAGYRFANDFETPRIGGTLTVPHTMADGTVANLTVVYQGRQKNLNNVEEENITVVTNSAYGYNGVGAGESGYWWRGNGDTQVAAIVTDPTGANTSQVFRTRLNYGQNGIKLYNAFRIGEQLDEGDLGRTYSVSYEIMTPQSIDLYTAPQSESSYVSGISGASYNPIRTRTTQNQWTEVNGTITINQDFVTNNRALLGIRTNNEQGSNTLITYYQYFDNFVVEEVVTDPVKVNKNSILLVTENTDAVTLTAEDNAVVDELYPSMLNQPIEVTFNTAMDITTLEKGMVVTNVATGNRVAGEWVATDATNLNFAFVTDGFVAGATYTIATTSKAKTIGGTACRNEIVKTVTMEGDYALRPLVSTYVSNAAPEAHYGLDGNLVLDTNKLGVLTFSAKTLKNADDAFLYMPWNAARKTFIFVYAIPNYLPDNSLCYNSVKAQLTEANLVLMDEWEAGNYALDLSALADKDLGGYVTLVIKAGYTFSNDFETPTLGGSISKVITLADNTTATVKPVYVSSQTRLDGGKDSNVTVVVNSAHGYNGVGKNLPVFWWRGQGNNQLAALVSSPVGTNNTQVFRTLLNYGKNGVKFYHVFRPDGASLTSDDIGKTYNVSFDYWAPQSITLYMAPVVYNGDISGFNANNSTGADVTGEQWNSVEFQLALSEANVTEGKNLLGIQTNNVKPADGQYNTYYQYFDNLKVEEVVSEFTLAKDSFILVTENEEVVDVTEADKPVVDVVYAAESKITGAEVALGSSITVNYYVSLDEAHAGAQMRFTVDGVKTLVDGVKSGKEYVYSYTGIAPQALGENIKAELIVDGEVVATKDEYSVLQNCKNLLGKTAVELGLSEAKCGAMKTLIADLLAYGAASQIYTGHNTDALVNEGIEGASKFVALGDEWDKLPTESTDETVELLGAGLYFTNTNKLYFRFAASDITEENFAVKIGDEAYTLSDFAGSNGNYVLYTEDILATELDTLYTVELVKNGETVQTLEYGVFAYIYDMQNNENEAMANVAKTLYNYSVAADAYANAR